MLLTDHIALDAKTPGVKTTREGFLVAEPRVARTGIQTYTAAEIGLTDRAPTDVIRVYRAEDEVFHKDALRSFAAIDLTIDHPKTMVDSKNWKDLAVGNSGESVLRDGEFMRLPIILKDQAAIDAYQAGKAELSVGYTCELVLEDGTTPTGEAYDARQTNIRANHLALCDRARGGSLLRIGDHQGEPAMKKIIVDGLEVETTDAAERAILKLQGQLADAVKAKDAAEADNVKLKAEAVTKDADIKRLTDEAAGAKITPAQMRDAAKAYAHTVAKAKALGATVTDEMDETAIMRAVVDGKMKDVKDEHLQVAFDALTSGVKVDDAKADPVRAIIGDGARSSSNTNAAAIRDAARLASASLN